MTAIGRNTPAVVTKATPAPVRTTGPGRDRDRHERVRSCCNVTCPVAFVWTTRLPVAGNSPEAVKSWLSRVAGITPPTGSTDVASGSARTVKSTGPTGTATGVTTTVAWGRTR